MTLTKKIIINLAGGLLSLMLVCMVGAVFTGCSRSGSGLDNPSTSIQATTKEVSATTTDSGATDEETLATGTDSSTTDEGVSVAATDSQGAAEEATAADTDALSFYEALGGIQPGEWTMEYVKQIRSKIREEAEPTIAQFVFIDDDDIPEMALYYGETGMEYELFTFYDGRVHSLFAAPYFNRILAVSRSNRCVNSYEKGRWREDAYGEIMDGELDFSSMGSVDLHAEPLAFQWNSEPVSEEEYNSFVKELLGGMEADIVIGMVRDESCVDHKEFWPAKEAMDILEQET